MNAVINEQKKACVVIIGPGRNMLGGVSTFVELLLTSPILKEKYTLIHLDTTRAPKDVGLEDRFSLTNITYFIQQVFHFIQIIWKNKPNIAHFQVTSGLSFWKAGIFIWLARISGIKTVAHLHGGLFDRFYEKSSPFKKKMIGWQFCQSDVVITLSNRWKDFLTNTVNPKIHAEVVSNTVDMMFADALLNTLPEVTHKEKIVLFLGSLGQRKGVFDILKAVPFVLEKHPDAIFLFAGEEESRGERSQIDQAVEEGNLSGKLQFIGKVTGEDKLKQYRQATLFLLPSYGENLPYSLLEAMAVGLPVIATPVGAIPEIIKDGVNGFFIQPGDHAALADRIIRLLEDQSLRQKMAEANIRMIREGYLPDAAMKRMDAIYNQLLNDHPNAGNLNP